MTENNIYELPAGKYIVGDPGYCFAHTTGTWQKICALGEADQENPVTTYNGRQILSFQCEDECVFGGSWYFPADTGTFGLTPLELVEVPLDRLLEEKPYLDEPGYIQVAGMLIESATSITCEWDGTYLRVEGDRCSYAFVLGYEPEEDGDEE